MRAGASPSQNGIVGGAPPRVLHAHLAALDAADAPRAVAEQEDVARHGLDGEVLVERADGRLVGLEHDLVVGGVGDGAARGDRGQPRAAPAPQPPPHRVAVKARARAPAPRGDALGQHVDHRVEVARGRARRRAPRAGPARRARPRPAPRPRRWPRSAGRGRRAGRAAGTRRSSSPAGPRARAPRTRPARRA